MVSCFRTSFLEEDEALQASPSQRAHTNSPKPPELVSPEVCLLQVPSAGPWLCIFIELLACIWALLSVTRFRMCQVTGPLLLFKGTVCLCCIHKSQTGPRAESLCCLVFCLGAWRGCCQSGEMSAGRRLCNFHTGPCHQPSCQYH